jgi:hypothetical protein
MTNLLRVRYSLLFQVYTGPYRKESTVTNVDNIWDHVKKDCFVAVDLENYDKPVISEVLQKMESTFQIEYWKASINKEWTTWITKGGEPWVDVLPKECIYLTAFDLDREHKLHTGTGQKIREFQNRKK